MRNRLTLLALGLAFSAMAQISEGGLPPTFSPESADFLAGKMPAPVALPTLNVAQAWADDDQNPGQNRFAAPINTDISLQNAGTWTTLPNGDRVWQCALRSSGALGLVLMFDEFHLVPGARFFASSPDGQHVFGAYTVQSMMPSGKFLIGVLPGDVVWLEYRVPAEARGLSRIHLYRVDYAYDRQALKNGDHPEDFGGAEPCNININCPLGNNYQTEKKGIARILMVFSNGSGWCSGSLIANTAGTPDPYVLTAQHCQRIGENPDFTLWRFDFNYEAPSCETPAVEPIPKSVLGCDRVAYRQETDFLLLRIISLPANYGLYFNGWSRDTILTNVSRTTFIHHPAGDLKKISQDTNPAIVHPTTINWGAQFGTSPARTHLKVVPDRGIFQPGSSGSPLFDINKRIVGQLHGGNWNTFDPCIILSTYFGRFSMSWQDGSTPAARLRDWLDPNGTGAMNQNGYAQPTPVVYSVSGTVVTYTDIPIPNCKIFITGSTSGFVYTDSVGYYSFSDIPAGGNYTVMAVRDTNDLNGVTTGDLALISSHILGVQTLNSPWKIIAADVNHSNSVTAADIIEARKLILGIYPDLPNNTAWRFFPASITFGNPQNPFSSGLPQPSLQISNLQSNYTAGGFKGVKVGDVNGTASATN